MGRILGPKCRQCRREGEKLYLKGERCYTSKCAIVKRNYAPGVHGLKGKPRQTEFGLQLREKQKAKRTYRLLEQQFRNYYDFAIKKPGNTGEIILQQLELRLDNAVHRAGFAVSRDLARQLVNHGHVTINQKPVDIPSYQLRAGDMIQVKETKRNDAYWTETGKTLNKPKLEPPKWMEIEPKNLTIKINQIPTAEQIQSPLNMTLIVEFYSR